MKADRRPVALVVLDGLGLSQRREGNAWALASTPNLDRWWRAAPRSCLLAAGEAVGLGPGQMGNSNVGHLNLGAGRVVHQDILRITNAVREGTFFHNPVLVRACRPGSVVHLVGLVSDGGVHSHQDHLEALLELARRRGVARVRVHAILDGRDVPPQSAGSYLERLERALAGTGEIASIMGRYYAMDRDNRWERVGQAYQAMVLGRGPRAAGARQALREGYARGETDEFLAPAVITGDGIAPGDPVILFNFRADRSRQLSRALADPRFGGFDREGGAPCELVTMTSYDEAFPLPHAFAPAPRPVNGLGEWVSERGLRQLRIAETEKYAHVTYFFSGGREAPYPGEKRVLVPSPRVATYDLRPEMSAVGVTQAVLVELDRDSPDLVILNYANPDMVGHTGVLAAAVRAVETVDDCLGRVIPAFGAALIVSDHGNAEEMIDQLTGQPHTAHTTNPVPAILVAPQHRVTLCDGILADVAPTVLELMGLPIPPQMTGQSLLGRV
ncbi:MAG: 2,3-bisphosphoglycerate-independent phosphoglycerate mutase [bacterium]|nr:2,3-bisphosphoglycerate-independent phosphoglycerate mutase [bacterium]